MRKSVIPAFVLSALMIWGALEAWRAITVDAPPKAESDTPHLAATAGVQPLVTAGIVGDDEVDDDGVVTPRASELRGIRPESRRVAVSVPPLKLTARRAATLVGVVVFRI